MRFSFHPSTVCEYLYICENCLYQCIHSGEKFYQVCATANGLHEKFLLCMILSSFGLLVLGSVQHSFTGVFAWLLAGLRISHAICFRHVFFIPSHSDQAWALLNLYLKRFGSKQNSIYYKCVCTRLLSMGCVLPTWLVNAYKVGTGIQ